LLHPIIAAGAAFVAGAYAAASVICPATVLAAAFAAVSLLAALALRRAPLWLAALAVTAGFGLAGALNTRLRAPLLLPPDDAPPRQVLARLTGVVDSPPIILPSPADPTAVVTRFVLNVESALGPAGPTPARHAVRVDVEGLAPQIAYGGRVAIVCKLRPLRPPENPGEINARQSLFAQGIAATASVPCPAGVSLRPGRAGSGFWRFIIAAKSRIRLAIQSAMPQRQAAVAQCFILGDAEALDHDQRLPFSGTGTVHFLAVSGLHVSIVAGFAWWVLSLAGAGRRVSAAAVIGVLLAYGLVAGMRPPIARSVVMGVIVCSAVLFRRGAHWGCSLSAAAIATLLLRPGEILSTGFQLSFAAVMGIMALAPPLSRAVTGLLRAGEPLQAPGPLKSWGLAAVRALAAAASVSVAAWAATLPLCASAFLSFVPLSPVFTLLLAPSVWLLLVAGVPGAFLSLVYPTLGAMILRVAELGATSLCALASILQHCPGAGPVWTTWAWPWTLATLGVLCAVAITPRYGLTPRRCAIAVLALVCAATWAAALRPAPPSQRIIVLSIAQGQAALVQIPRGGLILYGAGGWRPDAAARAIARAMTWMGRRRVDLAVIPSGAPRVANALPSLARLLPVRAALTTPAAETRAAARYAVQQLQKQGIPVLSVSAGDKILGVAGAQIEALHPPDPGPLAAKLDDNESALVLRVTTSAGALLLGPGGGPITESHLSRHPLRADAAITTGPHTAGLQAPLILPAGPGPLPDGAIMVDWPPGQAPRVETWLGRP